MQDGKGSRSVRCRLAYHKQSLLTSFFLIGIEMPSTSSPNRRELTDHERGQVLVSLLQRSVDGVPRKGAIKEVAVKFRVSRQTIGQCGRGPRQRRRRQVLAVGFTSKSAHAGPLCSAGEASSYTTRAAEYTAVGVSSV